MWITRERASMADGGAGRRVGRRRGFTLVELLVVIAIIALLVAILVPSLTGARTQAKIVGTRALIASLGAGLDAFKQESALGGVYPPSASDDTVNPGVIDDPIAPAGSPSTLGHTTGASLLVYALNGADQLGTPGFFDRDNDGMWSNDFGVDNNDPADPPVDAHATDDTTRDPLVPRYGPYAGTLTKDIRSFAELVDDGRIDDAWPNCLDCKHRVFVDPWGHPILYYRARAAAKAMVPTAATPVGVYDPSDNAYITGGDDAGDAFVEGLRLEGERKPHVLANVQANAGNGLEPGDDPRLLETDPLYLNSFERFIWDDKVTARIAPVNRKSFLLISAGPDFRYGTDDDVTNFQRK